VKSALSLLIAIAVASAQTPETHRAALDRIAKEADLFDKSAHRFAGIETLIQTLPKGSRTRRGPRGIETVLPEQVRTIVSEYGFIALDEPGGWIKEVRLVLTVDGLKWNKGKKGLDSLAATLSANDDKKKRSLLESYEDFGLQGFVSDLGQLILLFARGLISNYEISYESTDSSGLEPLLVYRYQQLGGTDALTIFEGSQPIRQKLEGRIWLRARDLTPVRLSLTSQRTVEKSIIRDVSFVEYDNAHFGILLPVRVTHRQYVDQHLFVLDEFTYSRYKQVLPAAAPR
jgi:hypothetical protein